MQSTESRNAVTDLSKDVAQKEKIETLIKVSGLSEGECVELVESTGWNIDTTIANINSLITGTIGAMFSKEAIITGIKNAGLYDKLATSLGQLHPGRGGPNGFPGFVFEQLHATSATINGQVTTVINNNGLSDFAIIGPDGKEILAQGKCGCNTISIDFSKYKGQTIVVDKGNELLIQRAKNAGLNVIESDVSAEEAGRLAKLMRLESKITGKPNSVAVPKIQAAMNVAKEAHNVGVQTAKTGAQFGGGFSMGSNLVEVISGDKEIGDAAVDVAKDTAVSAVVGYGVGAATTIAGNTAVGGAIASTAGSAATAVASTTVGGAVIAAGTTAAGAIGSLGTAAVTTTLAAGSATGGAIVAAGAATGAAISSGVAAVGTAGAAIGSAVAGTSVGGAAIAAGTAAGSAIAGTAVGGAAIAAGSTVVGATAAAGTAVAGAAVAVGSTAVGAAAVAGTAIAAGAIAAAPVVAVGLVLGGVWGIGKKIFGGD